MERALVGRAVADEADRHRLLVPVLLGKGPADGNGRPGADHGGGAGGVDLGHGQVQGAALAPVAARGPAEDLGHERVRVRALGEQVAVAAVVGDDRVRRFERGADPGRNPFLAGAEDHHAVDRALDGAEFGERLLEAAGEEHGAVHFQFLGRGCLHGFSFMKGPGNGAAAGAGRGRRP